MKKVLILMGSPRKNGNTSVLAHSLAEGADRAGAQIDIVLLQGLEINPCTGCNLCQGPEAAGCVVRDDMQEIYRKLREADSIIFASPVYWFSVTAQLKAAIDRIYAIGGGDKNVLEGKSLGILMAYADADPFVSGAVNALRMFQDISAYLGTNFAGAVYGSAYEAGEIAENKQLLKEAYNLGERLGKAD
ncbi:MAG: flavodoxin family protein [Pseudomonadota bacterium]